MQLIWTKQQSNSHKLGGVSLAEDIRYCIFSNFLTAAQFFKMYCAPINSSCRLLFLLGLPEMKIYQKWKFSDSLICQVISLHQLWHLNFIMWSIIFNRRCRIISNEYSFLSGALFWPKSFDIFVYSWKHMLWYSLEASLWDASNEYHNICF